MIPLKVPVQIATYAYGATKKITFHGDVLLSLQGSEAISFWALELSRWPEKGKT
jgi:hypothetical protein